MGRCLAAGTGEDSEPSWRRPVLRRDKLRPGYALFSKLPKDYFAVTGTSPGPEVSELIPNYRDFWEEALSDAIGHGQTLPGMAGAPVGLLGFSLGGHLCLRLRRKACALACFFAPPLDGLGTPGKLRHAQIHYGQTGNPSEAGYRNAKTIARTLEAEGTAAELCG